MKSEFVWGPFARGTYIALLWCVPFLFWIAPNYLFHYLAFLAFLGLGLRPLLQTLGLYVLFNHFMATHEERVIEKRYRDHRRRIMQIERDKRYKRSRTRHKDLPENW